LLVSVVDRIVDVRPCSACAPAIDNGIVGQTVANAVSDRIGSEEA
jgi:hypothetical protein